MSIKDQIAIFKSLGFGELDVRHIGVYVKPCVQAESGKLKETHKIYIGEGNGDFKVDYPTQFIFVSMNQEWVFESFDLAGKTWPGLAIFPDNGDFSIKFGDSKQYSIVLNDACTAFCAHRYQVVMKNKTTGEIIATDPSVENGDRD